MDKDNVQGLIAQLDALFEAASVAIVGVPRGMKMGKLFLVALLEQGFPGDIYPVNPQAKEIDGLKAYPSVSAIPGPVDLAIVLVPHDHALSVVKECAHKGVKGAVLFTAGYKETGTADGRALEEELVRVARSSGMRLIGPNGMGLYCPKTGLSFFPQVSKEPGPVGIISHSGSLTNILGRLAPQKGIRFSKVVSLGNECDLTSADFLTYLGRDPDTRVIGTYLEGIKGLAATSATAEQFHRWGVKEAENGNYNAADAHYQKAIKLDPELAPAYLGLAIIQFNFDHRGQAHHSASENWG